MRISLGRDLVPHRSQVAEDAAKVWTAELGISELVAAAGPPTIAIVEPVVATEQTPDRAEVSPTHKPRV